MYCRYCGKEIEEDAKFCKYCGKSQNVTTRDEDEVTNNPYINQANAAATARIDARLRQHFTIQPGTRIVMETTYHTILGLPFYICLIFEVLYSIITLGASSGRFYRLNLTISIIVLIVILVTAFFYLRLPLSEFAITENRLLIRVWPTQKIDIPINQIKTVTAEKGFFSRMDYGKLQITAGGQTYYFRCVACAEIFKDALIKQMNQAG